MLQLCLIKSGIILKHFTSETFYPICNYHVSVDTRHSERGKAALKNFKSLQAFLEESIQLFHCSTCHCSYFV